MVEITSLTTWFMVYIRKYLMGCVNQLVWLVILWGLWYTVDGCEILHKMKTVVYPSIFFGFQQFKVVQDLFHKPYSWWWNCWIEFYTWYDGNQDVLKGNKLKTWGVWQKMIDLIRERSGLKQNGLHTPSWPMDSSSFRRYRGCLMK